jgi:cytochrome P450 family 9
MFSTVAVCAEDFVKYCKDMDGDESIIDVKDLCEKFTANATASCVFGLQTDCLRRHEKILNITRNLASNLRFFKRKLRQLLLRLPLVNRTTADFLQQTIIDEMKVRQLKSTSRADVIQLLLHAKEGQLHHHDNESIDGADAKRLNYAESVDYDVNPKRPKLASWSDDDFVAQGLSFIGEGFGNTASVLTMLFYELAKDFDTQMELLDEIDDVNESLNGGEISYEILHAMKFLDCVISEALRLWPPTATTNRICSENCELETDDGRKIEFMKGDQIIIPIHAIHRDERFFEEPHSFDPHRFNEAKREGVVVGSYLPFGAGKRSCIASRFVLQEIKLVAFSLLTHFMLDMCHKTPAKIEFKDSSEKIYLRLKRRSK